ncbi:hypothetical protein PENSPDRAFT_593067, partial [Peniophora sp. CONT]
EFLPEAFHGRLQQVFSVKVPANAAAKIERSETFLLAGITPCNVQFRHNTLDIHCFKGELTKEVVDLNRVECSPVSRVRRGNGNLYAILDRSEGLLARRVYIPEDN